MLPRTCPRSPGVPTPLDPVNTASSDATTYHMKAITGSERGQVRICRASAVPPVSTCPVVSTFLSRGTLRKFCMPVRNSFVMAEWNRLLTSYDTEHVAACTALGAGGLVRVLPSGRCRAGVTA